MQHDVSGCVVAIAEALASSKYRFLTDVQIGTLRRIHKASRDEIRAAAIVADRIRRQRQLAEGRAAFAVVTPVDPLDAIALPAEPKARGKRFACRRAS
jgi:hypothetical protein